MTLPACTCCGKTILASLCEPLHIEIRLIGRAADRGTKADGPHMVTGQDYWGYSPLALIYPRLCPKCAQAISESFAGFCHDMARKQYPQEDEESK